jgi:hypothetical protein
LTIANVRNVTPISSGIICSSRRTMNPITNHRHRYRIEPCVELVVQSRIERIAQTQTDKISAE